MKRKSRKLWKAAASSEKEGALFSWSSINIAKKRQECARDIIERYYEIYANMRNSDKDNGIADWGWSTARREVLKLVRHVENIRVENICNHVRRYDRDNSDRLEFPTAQILFAKSTYVQRVQRDINT